jgi:hypothetical protein
MPKMKKFMIIGLACLAAFAPATAQQPQSAPKSIRSATRARDVNGFALGMNLADIQKRMQLTHVDGEVFTGKLDGVAYEFGVTPLGRVYRIESLQPLGRFNPDRAFTLSLGAKLEQKYGPPRENGLPDGVMSWWLTEPITHADGQTLPFTTMIVDASLSDDWGTQSLKIWMQDYRILWADSQRLNKQPRDTAIDRASF